MTASRPPILVLVALLCLQGCFSPIPLGSPVEFAPDEGLLVVSTDSPWPIVEMRAGLRTVVRDVEAGQQLLLVRAPVGRHRWRRVVFRQGSWHFRLTRLRGPSWAFRVAPGKISYSGHVLLDWGKNVGSAHLRVGGMRNRSAFMLEQLEERYPGVIGRVPIQYSGDQRDDFLAEFHDRLSGPKPPPVPATPLGEPGWTARLYFHPPETRQAVVSPSGSHAAYRKRGSTWEDILVYDWKADAFAQTGRMSIRHGVTYDLSWADDDTLLVHREKELRVIDVGRAEDGRPRLDELILGDDEGYVVDPLPEEPETVLYAEVGEESRVYRLDLRDLRRYIRGEAQGEEVFDEVVAELDARVWRWIADGEGRVRAALSTHGGADPRLDTWYRPPEGRWERIDRRGPDDPTLIPLGFVTGDRLLVASDEGRDRYALFDFDPQTRELGRVVYAHPSAQLVDVLFDYHGRELLAVAIFEGGERVYEFLDAAGERYRAGPEALFPGQSTLLRSLSRDGRFLTVLVTSPTNPGQHYLVDSTSWEHRVLGRVAPQLVNQSLVPAEFFSVTSTDGLRVEAILTRPPNRERPPLVVVPHGGPIGVHDEWGFDPLAQYLASRGYGVLKVNYRGSSGYGRSFLEAGERQWGTGIEDDIDAAVQHIIDQKWVDPERICILGSSYGGYSALMSAIRRPDRYRCAVSVAGVTDIPLMFISSDFSYDERARDRFAEIVGDPEEDYERLKSLSPAYRADEIRVPVLLAHGIEDRRVDVEHALRMKTMLELHGSPVEWVPMPGVGHALADTTVEAALYERVAEFLDTHLSQEAMPAAQAPQRRGCRRCHRRSGPPGSPRSGRAPARRTRGSPGHARAARHERPPGARRRPRRSRRSRSSPRPGARPPRGRPGHRSSSAAPRRGTGGGPAPRSCP